MNRKPKIRPFKFRHNISLAILNLVVPFILIGNPPLVEDPANSKKEKDAPFSQSTPSPLFTNMKKGNFFELYPADLRNAIMARVTNIGESLAKKNLVHTVAIKIAEQKCSLGEIDTMAYVGHEINDSGERAISFCLALLHSWNTTESAVDFWAARWKFYFDHEYKHVVDDYHLGFDAFTEDASTYVMKSRGLLSDNHLLPVLVAIPKDEQSKIELRIVISEVRVKLRILQDEQSFVLSEDIQRDAANIKAKPEYLNRYAPIFVSEIVARYLVENSVFRNIAGISLSPELALAYETLRDATTKLTQSNPTLQAIYNELYAHAKLAETEGFRMAE
ncbi:MAG: hypothetical protein Q7S22_05530 [Candidatus Micrarchaeota archaeon]|nr:hypothetical protein [Candidatus Micrarchaeota archaeon]